MQRLAKDAVEKLPGRARLIGGANLPEDLPFSGNERVESAGDAEQMERGRLVAQAVERGLDLRLELDERRDSALLGLDGVLRHHVQLGAIARREADGVAELGSQCRGLLGTERDALAQLDRSVVVRRADEDEVHHAKWLTGSATRTRMTSANPASAT